MRVSVTTGALLVMIVSRASDIIVRLEAGLTYTVCE